jgi:hypothetical protein
MLRQENLIQNNALFRATLDGRGAFDIMQTIIQTAMAAEVDPAAYLKWVLMMPKESIDAEHGAPGLHASRLRCMAGISSNPQ